MGTERDSIQDSTRYVVKNFHRGSIVPGNSSEISREVYLEPGAEVSGGIWADQLHIIEGKVNIKKSVFVRKSLFIEKSEPDTLPITFHSSCVASDAVVQNGQFPFLRFRTDLYAGKVNLKNAIIYGSLYADQVIMDHCIVLGGVYCRGSMTISNSIVFTFRANKANIKENTSILSPFAISDSLFQIKSPVNVLSLKDIFAGENPTVKGVLTLDETDIYLFDGGKNKEKGEVLDELSQDERRYIKDGGKTMYVLSMTGRVINAHEIANGFKANKNLIQFLSLNSHLSDTEKSSLTSEKIENIESMLFNLIEEKGPFPRNESTYTFEELLEKYNEGE